MFQPLQFGYTTPPNQESDLEGNLKSSSDDDYVPQTAKSNNDTTPSSRVDKNTSTSDTAKIRVDKATRPKDLTGPRCLLENTCQTNEVEYAHCLARATSSSLLYNLEYSWGLDARTLNLDTRRNILRLSVKFHHMFDDGRWFLVPEQRVIEMYLKALPNEPVIQPQVSQIKKPGKLLKIPGSSYNYTIFAHSNMRPVPLFRQKDESVDKETHENLTTTLTIDNFKFVPHPLNTVTVKSHVHPRYVICNIGRTLVWGQKVPRLRALSEDYYLNLGVTLRNIVTIYTSWSTLYDKHKNLKVEDALKFRKDEKLVEFNDDNVSQTAPIRVDDSDLPRRSKRSRTTSQAQE